VQPIWLAQEACNRVGCLILENQLRSHTGNDGLRLRFLIGSVLESQSFGVSISSKVSDEWMPISIT
jgi:hypothetical protein